MLEYTPHHRISARKALESSWLKLKDTTIYKMSDWEAQDYIRQHIDYAEKQEGKSEGFESDKEPDQRVETIE